MADTGGIAALLKALNDTPGLGAGLKPTPPVARSNAFAVAAGIAKPAATTAAATAAPARPIRSAATIGAAQAKPKVLVSDGLSYNARAPRGTYLDLVI
jgi:hypothetical protein